MRIVSGVFRCALLLISLAAPQARAASPLPAGCDTGANVKQDGSEDFTTIQAAVDAFPPQFAVDVCIVVRDTQTYAEQVTVPAVGGVGFEIDYHILGDPSFTSSAPVVSPPAGSTAAFRVLQPFVEIARFGIRATNAMPYGVRGEGTNLRLSSVSVAGGSLIYTAGVTIPGTGDISFSSVTVGDAHGIEFSGSGAISFSSASNASSTRFAVSAVSAFGLVVSDSYLSNGTGSAMNLDSNSANNSVLRSTLTAAGAGAGGAALRINGADSTIVSSCTINSLTIGINLQNGADSNVLYNNDVTAGTAGLAALRVRGSSSNRIERCRILNFAGRGLEIELGCLDTQVLDSRIEGAGTNRAALEIEESAFTTVSRTEITGSSAVFVTGSTDTILNSNRLTGAHGLWLAGGSSGLSMSSNVVTATSFGVLLDRNSSGAIVLSTNSFDGNAYSVLALSQMPGAAVWITSNTLENPVLLEGLTTGATIQNNDILLEGIGVAALEARNSAGIVVERNRLGLLTPTDIVQIAGGFWALRFTNTPNARVAFNDFVAQNPALYQFSFLAFESGSTGAQVRHNVFYSSSVAVDPNAGASPSSATISVSADSQAGFAADYNDYYSGGAPNTALWGGVPCVLPSWTGAGCPAQDAGSFAADPLWAAVGSGSSAPPVPMSKNFRPKSAAGRYNPATQAFDLFDSTTSATIDAGDPGEAVGAETAPNGGRVNLGSYGGTAEASRSLAGAPSAAQIAAVHLSSVTANWGVVPTANGYRLESSLLADFSSVVESSVTAVAALSTLTLTNVAQDATYYFRVGSLNTGGVANHVFIASISINSPPNQVVDLSTLAAGADDRALLRWTAPGNNGSLGTASFYEIRYSSTVAITPANFGQAILWSAARPVGGPAGTIENETITGLAPSVTHYFALKARDAVPNVAQLSNVPAYLTGVDVAPSVVSFSPADGAAGVALSTAVVVRFSKVMSTSSFAVGGFTLRAVLDKDGAAISSTATWTVVFTTQTRTATFTPDLVLGKNVTYEVVIGTAARDPQGVPMASSVTWRFLTPFDRAVSNVVTARGIRFSIPANAFAQDGYLAVSTPAASSAITAANAKLLARDRFKNPANTMEITARTTADVVMQPSVALSAEVPFSDANGDGFVDGLTPVVKVATLSLWTLDEAAQAWTRIPGATVDSAAGVVRTPVPHFSFFGLIGGQNTSLDDAHAFPVPYVPSKQTVRVITFTGLSSSASIKIFTIDGRLVRAIDESDGDGRATWDVRDSSGRDASSGVYLYAITNDSEKAIGKLVIIR